MRHPPIKMVLKNRSDLVNGGAASAAAVKDNRCTALCTSAPGKRLLWMQLHPLHLCTCLDSLFRELTPQGINCPLPQVVHRRQLACAGLFPIVAAKFPKERQNDIQRDGCRGRTASH